MDSLTQAGSVLTKDDLINRAHEARRVRELARRRELAAVTIQAHLRGYIQKLRLKHEADQRLHELTECPVTFDGRELVCRLRFILFACRPINLNTLDSLVRIILGPAAQEDSTANDASGDPVERADPEANIHSSKHLVNDEHKSLTRVSSTRLESNQRYSLLRVIRENCSKTKDDRDQWLFVLTKVMNLCFRFLSDADSLSLNSGRIDSYLHLVNICTSPSEFRKACQPHSNELIGQIEELDSLPRELFMKTLHDRRTALSNISSLLCEKMDRLDNDLKPRIVSNYIQIVIGSLDLRDASRLLSEGWSSNVKESSEILLDTFSIPGLIHHLEEHSPGTLTDLNGLSLFSHSIRLLLTHKDMQKLTSTSSVCLLANLTHLASLNRDALEKESTTFFILAKLLLGSCQKNMLQSASAVTSGVPQVNSCRQNNKKSVSGDVSFNPILGWLTRERAANIDKEIIKSQLSHLWSKNFLKIMLVDLKDTITCDVSNNGNKIQNYGSKHKSISPPNTSQSYGDNNRQSLSPGGILRRAMERAATTVSRTIHASYTKSPGTSSNSARSKLLTQESQRIALVCSMLYTSLRTLSTMKQDILTGLCLQDYILPYLWSFISSLGPDNGLRTFLEHLTFYTKTDAPEFHILTLFCECASHLISILDDSELYEKQQPFRLDDLVRISAFLNNFVFRVISNNLIAHTEQDQDPVLLATHKLLTDLYKRDCRRRFAPKGHWLIKDTKMTIFLKDLEIGKPTAKAIMTLLPHIIPHKERVLIFRRLVAKDKSQYCAGLSTLITIHRSRIVEDGYRQLARLPPHALKGLIRVKFINDYGLDEAGIDQDGVFKEFLEDTFKRVFDPALNLFCSTSEQRLYPSPTSRLHEDYLSLFNFVGKMLGKAVYEGIVVDVPFATFFLSRLLGKPQSTLYSPIDELPSLDPELYKSLTYIKHYEGDVSELDLTFSIDQDFMGKIETHELESGGRSIPVTRESRVRYIHSVANFRMRTQIAKQTDAFINGFKSIINLEWLSMFSASEFQRLISGDNRPIDLQDLRRHTKYFGGFHNNHRVVSWLWDILEKDFSPEEHKLFLKFVTSCSKPPLLGFANLEPPFSIRCVEVSDDLDLGDTVGSVLRGFFAIRRSDPVDRLPTSSTCFNLLKLPNYQRRSTLREKLRYAIRSNPGFELS